MDRGWSWASSGKVEVARLQDAVGADALDGRLIVEPGRDARANFKNSLAVQWMPIEGCCLMYPLWIWFHIMLPFLAGGAVFHVHRSALPEPMFSSVITCFQQRGCGSPPPCLARFVSACLCIYIIGRTLRGLRVSWGENSRRASDHENKGLSV